MHFAIEGMSDVQGGHIEHPSRGHMTINTAVPVPARLRAHARPQSLQRD